MTSDSAKQGMTCSASVAPIDTIAADLLIVPIFETDTDAADLAAIDRACGGDIARARASGEFRGKPYEALLAVAATGKTRRVLCLGAGRPADADAERLRRIAAAGAYAARTRRAKAVAWLVRGPIDASAFAQAVADGMSAAEFEIGAYKKADDGAGAASLTVVAPGGDAKAIGAAVARGRIVGRAVNFARRLANEPGNVLTPREFADRIAAGAKGVGLPVEILDEHKIRDLKMNLLLGVAAGSAEPPRVVVIRHEPPNAPKSPVIALVGKGITFDTGGISIKPAENMERMKDDMTGGASVAAAMCALKELNAPFRVLGIIPTTENMPGGKATRPGDVLTGASGKTVEVINTDAEGRLILGDALWYAQQLGATHMIDVATLTGACMVALGRNVSGLFGQPESWVEVVRTAAKDAGDRVWPMPIYEEAKEQIRSDIADIVNSGGRPGGAVTAAAFLREFAGEIPWAHLDIAGTAWAEANAPYQPKGPTGVSVRTLIELGETGGGSGPRRAD